MVIDGVRGCCCCGFEGSNIGTALMISGTGRGPTVTAAEGFDTGRAVTPETTKAVKYQSTRVRNGADGSHLERTPGLTGE